jgi:hypothetical protein
MKIPIFQKEEHWDHVEWLVLFVGFVIILTGLVGAVAWLCHVL